MGVRVSVEGARGCGYRKEGGLYLVSGQLSEPCPLLPVETEVCPTCGEGIRPARGFTWVDGAKFIPPQVHGTAEHSAVCPLAPEGRIAGTGSDLEFVAEEVLDGEGETGYVSRIGRCGLIWIGEQHYKTPQEFMAEAAQMGVSRRITAVPRDFEIGTTWVLLGHRKAIEKACSECGDLPESSEIVEGVGGSIGVPGGGLRHRGPDPDCPVCNGTGYEWKPGIITAFRPTAIEYVVKPEEEDDEELLESLEKRGISPVKVVRAEQEAML